MRVFVQGDRDAKGCKAVAQVIAMELRQRQVGVNLGAYGELVEIFFVAGCEVRCFGHRESRGRVPEKVTFTDCMQVAKDLKHPSREVAWGLRLGLLMEASDAFLFFAGREGTVAHLVPVLAFASKRWREKPRKVALVGWDQDQIYALTKLMGPMPNGVRFFGADPTPAAVVDFLTN